ncbi:MAG: PQQ-binding-like beta-propeller repeat protein, partial [bacterium]
LWQLIIPKLRVPMADFRGVGVCSPPTVVGDRVYLFSNRGEVLCLDVHGQADGNDGPYRDEGRYMVPQGAEPMEVGKLDADILWRCDALGKVRMRLHDAAHCSVMVHRGFVYSGTCNGVDETHFKLPRPQAPSLVAVEQGTGRLVATDGAQIGPQLIHCMWSSPSLGEVAGRELMFFGGGDGVCYAFEPLKAAPPAGERAVLKVVWRFHCDPAGRKDRPLDFQDNRKEGPSLISGMPVFYRGRVYVTAGGDVWHGKPESWLKCIDASGSGDITTTGERWSQPLHRHCMATPAIADGVVYITDTSGRIHCFDAVTGRPVWVHQTGHRIWGSPLVADGKVYVGTMQRHLVVLAADRRKKVLADIRLDSPVATTPVAANGVVYVAAMRTLYALTRTK